MDDDKPQCNTMDDDDKIMFKMWLQDQWERYDQVKKSVEAYFNATGKILPYDKPDFMKWFVMKAKSTNDYLGVKIEDHHFEEYHHLKLKKMVPPLKWEGLYNDLKTDYIETTPEIFNSIMEYKRCPGGTRKARWLTFKADAWYFFTMFGFKEAQINDCCIGRDGTKITRGSKSNGGRKKPFTIIVDKYKSLRNDTV